MPIVRCRLVAAHWAERMCDSSYPGQTSYLGLRPAGILHLKSVRTLRAGPVYEAFFVET